MSVEQSISNGRSHAMENYVDFSGGKKKNASGMTTDGNKYLTYFVAAAGIAAIYYLIKRK